MSHESWEELAAGYVLHALEPDEELQFGAHLATCDRCQDLVAADDLVAAQLGSLAHDDEASAPTWSSLRAGIVGTAPASPPAPAPDTAPVTASGTVVDLDTRRRFRRHTRLLGAAAAAVVLAGAGVAVWQTSGTTTSSATRAISACEHRTGCSVVRLHTPDGAAPAVVLVASGSATMVPTAMSAPPTGREYVLWQLLRNGGPAPVGTFHDVTADALALVAPYGDTAAFAVSVEPDGAAPLQPTKVIAVGNTT